MQDRAGRRIPVVEGDNPVRIVSLGDLAPVTDIDSTEERIAEARRTVRPELAVLGEPAWR
jgi:hypothetical protein